VDNEIGISELFPKISLPEKMIRYVKILTQGIWWLDVV
jgi:hypothetical protein